MVVDAPREPGRYRLRPALVQEDVRWFDVADLDVSSVLVEVSGSAVAQREDDLQLLAQFDHRVRRVDPGAQLDTGVDLGARARRCSRVDHRVAAGHHAIAEDAAELAPSGAQPAAFEVAERCERDA